jgi:hypothetical protein
VKFFFEPASGPYLESGEKDYLGRVIDPNGEHEIVGSRQLADVIFWRPNLESRWLGRYSRFLPLSASDMNSFTYNEEDHPTGRFSGLYCALPLHRFDLRRHRTIPYLLDYNELIEEFPLEAATKLVGFMGQARTGLRQRIFELCAEQELADGWLIRAANVDWRTITSRDFNPLKQEYAALMRSSKFILCPRGKGVSSIRFFETLKAGRVPVLISDSYVLPSKIHWDRCCVSVPESALREIPSVIAHYEDRWKEMARTARQTWEAHFSPSAILGYIAECVKDISAGLGSVGLIDAIKYSRTILSDPELSLRPLRRLLSRRG